MNSSVHSHEFLSFLDDCRFKNSFTARQLREWTLRQQITDFSQISNVPQVDLDRVNEKFSAMTLRSVREVSSGKSKTVKHLMETASGEKIEAVLIESRDGSFTLCLSSQVGCSFDCAFCATGKMGFSRNLHGHEIVEQYVLLNRLSGNKIKNIVFMGMGEPFANADAVFDSLSYFTGALGLSATRLSLSTIGLFSGIERLGHWPRKVNLLLSLHSAIQEKRDGIMPHVKNQKLTDLKTCLIEYQRLKQLPVTLEYILIEGFNHGKDDAEALVRFSRGLEVKVNLIAYNRVVGLDLSAPPAAEIENFKTFLIGEGLNVVQRFKKGDDIAAACGQLAVHGQAKQIRA